jgi:hypothetical protein
MNWQDLIYDAELVYNSTDEDKGFRTWSLKKTTCNVSFYETYPIEDIDKIICGILDSNNGYFEEKKIATILGFNVVDDFEITQKRYADKAELDIFRAIIKHVFNWGLVEQISEKENPIILKLTDLGYRALLVGEKYIFYSGQKKLLENPNIKPAGLKENLFFPFYSAFGEFSKITGKTQIKYEQVNIMEVFDIEESELFKRHKLQSNEYCPIYKSEQTYYFEFASSQVDIRLYKQGSEYYPIIFHNHQICIEATELLNSLDNVDAKEKKIEWGLYLKLIKDPTAVLDFQSLIPFEDLLELDTLVKDTRLNWNDKQLFSFIAENASANVWFNISNHCPIDVLKHYLQTYSDNLDWISLSLRIDDDFLIQNATKFPWNFEVISAKEDISIEVIKFLLLIPELKEQEWDWDRIMPKLDFEFIKANINTIDFELSDLTKTKIDNIKPLLIQYPTKRWNWKFISTDYDLPYILDNIHIFSNFLNLKNVINRAFISENDINLFCQSSYFVKVLSEANESILRDYQPNQAKYFWTEQLIDLLERTGYLTWESGSYISGFECNPFIDWSADFFNKYHSKIKTQKGLDFISSHISDSRIVIEFHGFNWNWDIISGNTNLIINTEFLLSVKDKLNYSILLKRISSKTLEEIFDAANVLSYLETTRECWPDVTERSTKEFVLKHIDYNWDWSILTRRFSSTINIDALGNPKWVYKWDWKYLTQNLELKVVAEKLDLYIELWDWEFLSKNIKKDFILTNLRKYMVWWKWNILLTERLDKQDLLLTNHLSETADCISFLDNEQNLQFWQIITQKFNYSELVDLISKTYNQEVFHWDYAYFYNMPDFHTLRYVEKYSDYTDWKIISESEKLNKEFRHNSKLTSEHVWLNHIQRKLDNPKYKWDFSGLSKLQSINENFVILNKYKDKLDWDFLSLNSNFFTQVYKDERKIRTFQKFINFQFLSQKADAGVSDKIVSKYIRQKWNWSALSSTITTKTLEFINVEKDKPWDWKALSARKDILFENEIFIELSNQNWDWDAISTRADITFSEELVIKLSDKPLNWYIISQSKTFVPNAKTLSVLKTQNLDWKAISKNTNLSPEILWDYKNSLDWLFVTKNQVVNISDSSFLNKYQDYVDWNIISQSEKFLITVESLKLFKDKLNWIEINSRKDFKIYNELLEPFSNVLDWSNISKSIEIKFTAELIEKYRNKWDWQLLRKNAQIIDKLSTTMSKYQSEFNCVDFFEKFDSHPYIYHFTHLFNAIPVLKNRKILSRDKAKELGLLKYDAAGTVVERSSKAHSYARFYFRPKTPTQFYNECLGWDGSLITNYGKSYYGQARNLGLPKCPIPVFFKFDLKEVLMKMPDKCYYSTGNMQTDRAKVLKVGDNPNYLQTNFLYDNISDAFSMAGGPYNFDRQRHISIMEKIKEYSQQEFLVFEEFDFSKLESFEIICYNDEYADLLKSQLGNDPICKKINANGWDIFHRGNRKLIINETETEISISSEYQDSAYLSIKGEGLKNIEILNPDRIQKETTNEIIAYPEIKFTKTEQPIEVHFVDTTIGTRDWLVYKN